MSLQITLTDWSLLSSSTWLPHTLYVIIHLIHVIMNSLDVPESRKHCVTYDCHGCTCGHFEFKYLLWAQWCVQLFCKGFFVCQNFSFFVVLVVAPLLHYIIVEIKPLLVVFLLLFVCEFIVIIISLGNNSLPIGCLIAQLIEHCTGITRVWIQIPFQPWIFSGLLCLKCRKAFKKQKNCNDHINLVHHWATVQVYELHLYCQ